MLVEKKNPFEGRINSSIALSSITTFRKKVKETNEKKVGKDETRFKEGCVDFSMAGKKK